MAVHLTYGTGIGLPLGSVHPSSWAMPSTAGVIASRNNVNGTGGTTGTLQSGRNIDATLTGNGGISSAVLGLIVSVAASISGTGGITTATAQALATLLATLTGSGSVTATAAGLAQLRALLTGAGAVSATNTALMDIAATIRGYGDLTPEGIRDAVWNALAATLTAPGTAGAALLAAGSAGDPWGTPLPGAYTPGSAGALVGALLNGLTPTQQAQLLDIWQRLGLDPANPLTTDANAGTIEAGGVSQTAAEPSTGVSLITRIP